MNPRWRDAFVLTARMRDVPGTRIGEALAEVEAHCAESGETPTEAFGDPVEYARAIADQAPARPAGRGVGPGRGALATGCYIAATALLLEGSGAVTGRDLPVLTTGTLVSVLVGAAYVFGLLALADRLSLWGTTWRLPVLVLPGVALIALPSFLMPQRLVYLSGVLAFGASAVLFGIGWLITRISAQPDLIVDPRTGTTPMPAPRWALAVIRFMPLLFLAATVAVVFLLPDA
ncbi:hypothetical protein GCM10009682_14750 [Luedemannella flava]|uniref:Uncharacterized protein n=1 Tax=Luedemannella flava TaxID=349316 RepID=A0ABN2LN07_9ACTN